MGSRPTHINLNEADYNGQPQPPRPPFYMDLPSPRTGEAPPALSPLDAFALQSRMLARRFEDESSGRRISRLPHRDVAKEFGHRPGAFGGSMASGESGMSNVPEVNEDGGLPPSQSTMEITAQDTKNRPVSHYPMFGNVTRASQADSLGTPFYEAEEYLEEESERDPGYFGFAAPRAASPEQVDVKMGNVAPPTPNMPSLTSSVDSVQSSYPPRTTTNGSARSYRSLAPPRSPAFPRSPRSVQSIRSVRQDSGDDDASIYGSHPVSSRKFSGSSNMSQPNSPLSPWMQSCQRSPSMTSEFSTNGSQQAVRAMNFSRPMSSASNRPPVDARPSLDSRSSFETRPSTELLFPRPSTDTSFQRPSHDLPLRNVSTAGSSIRQYATSPRQLSGDDSASSLPSIMTGPLEGFDHDQIDAATAASYTYSKFALPRGRGLERHSKGLRESWIQSQFTWDKENPSQEQQASQDAFTGNSDQLHDLATRPPSSGSAKLPQERQERIGRQRAMSSANRSRSAGPRPFSFENTPKAEVLPRSSPSVRTHATDSTERTIKAKPLHERAPSSELTPEVHLEIGIQAHSRGELNKSTYHLRLAAKAGLPTAMLLYALACRHGWGMRPNQKDGVMWLRKAIETSGIEVTDVEETLSSASRSPKADPVAEAQERKKRKAQFALAIYELGISYMNGWGCPKDKPLAVRCYEVAGSWGDCDALAEAGFCYTQGAGVKKDLKKAAAYYRKAAEGGMSMAGNSWIYKPKYMDDASKTPEKDKKQQPRSDAAALLGGSTGAGAAPPEPAGAKTPTRPRARSIWGRGKKEKAP